MEEPVTFKGQPSMGVVYTKQSVVSLILDLIGYVPSKDLSTIRIMDVGCGYGQFIGEVTRRFALSCKSHGLNRRDAVASAKENLRGVEIDPETAMAARSRICHEFDGIYGAGYEFTPMGNNIVHVADFLDWNEEIGGFEFIVGNLPYVKYESIKNLPNAKDIHWIQEHYSSFRGRADYSVAFVEEILKLLAEKGKAGIITSNRFTQSEYGKNLRIILANAKLHLDELDLSGVDAFDDDVSAYASAFLIKLGDGGSGRYIRLRSMDNVGLSSLLRADLARAKSTQWYSAFSRGTLPRDGTPWAPLPGRVVSILRRLERNHPTICQAGFAVRNGPATGANGVFIRGYNRFPMTSRTKKRYLLPLYSSRRRGLSGDESANRYLLSVYEPGSRRLLDLDEIPNDMRDYLLQNKRVLEERYIVKNEGKEWWRTIDSYDPDIMRKHKVLIPDLQYGQGIRFDWGRHFPDHTVAYVIGASKESRKLTAVLRSPIIDLMRLWKSPAMRGGTPRASANAISRLPCPDLDRMDSANPTEIDAYQVFNAYEISTADVARIESIHSTVLKAF